MFLFVDVSHKGFLILKLLDRNKILDKLKKEGDFKLTEKLLFFIDELLNENSIELKDLQGIVVVNGPGAFTSLRIMSVVINTISAEKNIPVYFDCFENLDKNDKIIAVVDQVKLNNKVIPFYDKDPSITISKK